MAVIHAFTRRAFYDYGGESSLQLLLTTRYLRGIAEAEGAAAFDALHRPLGGTASAQRA